LRTFIGRWQRVCEVLCDVLPDQWTMSKA
jgi:hypothetical protein